ncbi:ParB/RepB/Spo0J family partition protein [Desulfatibacillum aliphaticivorans]|uniref:ParB/RepB/Spo0J family partition protein n=1 Tax=Desulfatibacillum aliphaticivorans TaxID=218208 RepID=UPI00040F0472|nr:ParB/RepB/Spo0J family partition protein [Desulfatibacillum aliphaticivorans]
MHTPYETYWLALDSIDSQDLTFKISSAGDDESLKRSVESLGLINPPLVQESGGGMHRVISGFRRVDVCRELDMRRIQVRVVDPLTSDQECAVLAVAENAGQRELDMLETSRSLALLGAGLPWKDRADMIKDALFLTEPPNQRRMEQVESLCSMHEEILEGVKEDAIAFPIALKLHEMEEAEALAFVRFFRSLALSLGKQREILTLAVEIAARDDLSCKAVLESDEVAAILNDADKDMNQKAREARALLKKTRFPQITRAQEAFEAEVQGLNLPKGVRLDPPANFEGQVYELKFYFKNINDLIKNHNVIIEIAEKPGLRKILDR